MLPLTPKEWDCGSLLDCHRLGQIPGEVHVKTLRDSQPVGNQLQRYDIEKSLENIASLRNHNALSLVGRELWVILIADDNWSAGSSNDCKY